MTTDQRLGRIAGELSAAGVDALVMGGHAVRYYGVDRKTVDFDFYTGLSSTDEVRARLNKSQMLRGLREGPSWRPADFARFEVGKLPDGREEWLEFWIRNHLLEDFRSLRERGERGSYGGAELWFLSLPDLMRSKETEREGDWKDIHLLEEVYDARNIVAATDVQGIIALLSRLRSRRGFDRARENGMLNDGNLVRAAALVCEHPVSSAFLVPLLDDVPQPATLRWTIDKTFVTPLRKSAFGESQHLTLVEVVRRAYKRWAMEIDRQDKQHRLTRK
jgi:hypothetical protein